MASLSCGLGACEAVTPASYTRPVTRDARLLFVARGLRMFAYGSLAVILVLYLAATGLDGAAIGVILSLTLVGDTLISLWLTTQADRFGRRRTLIVGGLLMAAAGAVFGIIYPFNPGSHYDLISRLLSIVVLGGLGSLGGAVVAALLLGVAESVVAVTISPSWSSFVFFVVLIVILLFRPQGLFGLRERGAL